MVRCINPLQDRLPLERVDVHLGGHYGKAHTPRQPVTAPQDPWHSQEASTAEAVPAESAADRRRNVADLFHAEALHARSPRHQGRRAQAGGEDRPRLPLSREHAQPAPGDHRARAATSSQREDRPGAQARVHPRRLTFREAEWFFTRNHSASRPFNYPSVPKGLFFCFEIKTD